MIVYGFIVYSMKFRDINIQNFNIEGLNKYKVNIKDIFTI